MTAQCEGISGVINETEVGCIYDSRSMLEKCKFVYTVLRPYSNVIQCQYYIPGELPITIDIARYDRDPGTHNITVIANSTLQQTADNTLSFIVQGY